jgi:hypothetical protein
LVKIDLEKCKNNGINVIIENGRMVGGFECSIMMYCYLKYKDN